MNLDIQVNDPPFSDSEPDLKRSVDMSLKAFFPAVNFRLRLRGVDFIDRNNRQTLISLARRKYLNIPLELD